MLVFSTGKKKTIAVLQVQESRKNKTRKERELRTADGAAGLFSGVWRRWQPMS
jgi:hypothetical protein